MKYIKFAIKSSSKEDGVTTNKFIIGRIESNLSANSNEFPILLHALAKSVGIVQENTGFPYTFPFELK